jgi:murein DD-endopeptidase MepM/ murein hydrolase activator NlpD
MKLTVPGAKTAAVAPAPVAAPAPAVSTAPATKMVAAAQPQSARLVQPTANVQEPAAAAEAPAVRPSEATGALPTFRWPVRGKVITSYGAKTNGKSNDGINVAVPEGTPVKAAEDGVVAYSGNELKGYGNLVLVRHSNGYVTAYAHASELLVKRGDTIKRGQVIAKSGQSGEVGSPQLHFEIRKGSSPVDPLQFLNGA